MAFQSLAQNPFLGRVIAFVKAAHGEKSVAADKQKAAWSKAGPAGHKIAGRQNSMRPEGRGPIESEPCSPADCSVLNRPQRRRQSFFRLDRIGIEKDQNLARCLF